MSASAPSSTALHPQTQAIHAATARSAHGENAEALFLTSGYVQPDAATAARRFNGDEAGYTYGRYGNPTVDTLQLRLAALEGAQAAIAIASGMSAILMLCMGVLRAGDHVVCSQSMFGSTIKLLGTDMARFGVQARFVPQSDLDAWRAAITPQTRLLFAETPTNPVTEVCDIAALAEMAHQAGALLAVDNSFATPVLQRPLSLGADVVMHSGTKFLDGQGRVMAGSLCASQALVDEAFMPILKSGGMALSPFNAWVLLKALETLALRVRAQSASALLLAQYLQEQPQVQRVYHPGLPSHPQHALAMRQQDGCGGAVLSFVLKAADAQQARARAFALLDALRLIGLCTNLGDTKTLAAHPASTSHGRLSEEQRQASGVEQGMVRLAVGLEHIDDLRADLAQALHSLNG